MAEQRFKPFGLLTLTLVVLIVKSKQINKHINPKVRDKIHQSRSKIHVEKGSPWPFLPSPGSHHTKFPGYPSYPFMIVSPPDVEPGAKQQQKDAKGSKYYTSRRQAVAYPSTGMAGYVPLYYMVPQYPTNQAFFTNYQPYENNAVLDSQYLQFSTYGSSGSVQPYPMNTYLYFKRSGAKKLKKLRPNLKQVKRQFLPRNHWAFSQWPFDSHEYAFTNDPTHSASVPHSPRWGPREWGGAGPGKHWGINRENLASPFGIGLAPHMGGQGYIGLGGHWPAGHGYPLPTNFPTSPLLQHHLP